MYAVMFCLHDTFSLSPPPPQLHVVKGDIAAASVQALVHPTGAKFPLAGQVGSALEAVEGAKLRKALEELHKNHGPLAPCGGRWRERGVGGIRVRKGRLG